MALNYYRLLGVPPDSGQQKIKSAYRSLAKRFTPTGIKAPKQLPSCSGRSTTPTGLSLTRHSGKVTIKNWPGRKIIRRNRQRPDRKRGPAIHNKNSTTLSSHCLMPCLARQILPQHPSRPGGLSLALRDLKSRHSTFTTISPWRKTPPPMSGVKMVFFVKPGHIANKNTDPFYSRCSSSKSPFPAVST